MKRQDVCLLPRSNSNYSKNQWEDHLYRYANNVLKNRGYHLKHNFGHGNEHLSSLLATLNILAFLFHSFLTFCGDAYRLIRATLHTRQTFFDPIRCLTCDHCFESWEAIMRIAGSSD